MSLWWAKREQLDKHQVELIENLPLRGDYIILGPPGSGKTNVLLRRAQYLRLQGMSNVLVLTYTRALTEFVKTGCVDAAGREIFPRNLVSTLESWMRSLYSQHNVSLPPDNGDLPARKAALAKGALEIAREGRVPQYEALFVDEAQDLMIEEIELLRAFSQNLFFVGDDRQKIYNHAAGLEPLRALTPKPAEHTLPFHYRLVDEVCAMADKIQKAQGNTSLTASSHYDGPRPGRIEPHGPLTKPAQINEAITILRDQVRVYADMILQGDRLGVIVPYKTDRDLVFSIFEQDEALRGKSQIIRARSGSSDDLDYDPTFTPDCPIAIMTTQACKGLEFRATHWLFCDELANKFGLETYYTVITRSKTSLDLYYTSELPQVLARSYSPPAEDMW